MDISIKMFALTPSLVSKLFLQIILVVATVICVYSNASATEIVLTLPFENVSNRAEYNWVRESFTVSMADLLDSPGIIAIGLDERNVAFDKLHIPNTAVISRATEIKLGEAINADLLIRGTYKITGEGKDCIITVKAQILSLREGRFLGNDHTLSGPITELQVVQGKLAWELLYQRNIALPFSRDQLLARSARVSSAIYENYVKALLIANKEDRIKLLLRAIEESSKEGQPTYPEATYQLATLYYKDKQYTEAQKWYEKNSTNEAHSLESKFFLGVCQYQTGQIDLSLKNFSDLLNPMPLYELYNNTAVLELNKGNLANALRLIKLAADAAPYDSDVQFNYGYALWKNNNFNEAITRFENAIRYNKQMGQAYYLLAKSFDKIGSQDKAVIAFNEAKKLLPEFAKFETSGVIPVLAKLKYSFNKETFYRYLRSKEQDRQSAFTAGVQMQQVEGLMSKAQAAFLNGKDEDALNFTSQVLRLAPDSSEAHLLMGRIHERRGDFTSAINSLRAAVFWNPKLVTAHVLLGRIYLSQKDYQNAEVCLKLALSADPNDREALALQRLLDKSEKHPIQ